MKIKNILMRNGFEVTAVCVTGAQVMGAAAELEGGIIISGIRYADMVYHELAGTLPACYEMVVIASHTQWEECGDDTSIWLPLPVKVYDLVSTVEDLQAEMIRRLKKRKYGRKRSKEEEGLISQAKECLMRQKALTEEEAHRYLQRISMDSGNNMVDTAYMVLKLYH